MAELCFEDLAFYDEGKNIRVVLLKIFFFYIAKDKLRRIAPFTIEKNKIVFDNISKIKAINKFNRVLSSSINSLRSSITGRRVVYIHQNSGIPLIGTLAFGIVDRNTSLIELRPITGCNLNCIFCSVDEGPLGKKQTDFVVEKDYLVSEFKKIASFKQCNSLEAHINTQGEPTLYSRLVDLVRDISSIKGVRTVSIDTNGTLLTKHYVNALVKAGLKRFNFSINALNQKLAEKIAGTRINLNHVLKIAEYASKKAEVLIAPVLVPGINERELDAIIDFAKSINARVGIQNFLNYKHGRNPAKQLPWQRFNALLKRLEKKHKLKLILDESDFGIVATRHLPKPFKRGDIVTANIVCPGRLHNEKLAVSKDRCITVRNCDSEGKTRIKITRTKHNIFYATKL